MPINKNLLAKENCLMDEVLKTKDVSSFLKVPEKTIQYLVSTGQIPFSRIGKRGVRFSKNRIMDWFNSREGIEYRLKRNS